MPTAHLYLFSDACPSDWLTDGFDDIWHTIVYLLVQSDPCLQPLVERGAPHEAVLAHDASFVGLIDEIQSKLPGKKLRQWKYGNQDYRSTFCTAFAETAIRRQVILTACSFQEKTLRASKRALIEAYNTYPGGIEGRGIGFQETTDHKGRLQMKHAFLNFSGYHEIKCPENQMLVLLLMSWFLADQYSYFRKLIVESKKYGFERLSLTVVSDMLSGDDRLRPYNEVNLRNLIDPEEDSSPIVLTRSTRKGNFPGDLIADNMAGWLNRAISEPTSEYANHTCNVRHKGMWAGWHELVSPSPKIRLSRVIDRL